MQNKLLIINASIRGKQGNSYALALKAKEYLQINHNSSVEIYTLTEPRSTVKEVYDLLKKQDAFLIISGSYWDNMGSALQRFVEVCTTFENTEAFWGKPVSVIISMDSVGGLAVADKILRVFSGLGCWSSPCSTVVLSRLGEEAVRQTKNMEEDPNEDVWRLEDIEILIDNLMIASSVDRTKWKAWPNSQLHLKNKAWPESGELDLDNPKFF